MERARILLIEDAVHMHEIVQLMLLGSGHEIRQTATTRDEALTHIDHIKDRELDCNVVILDGNLSPGSKNGEDAIVISRRICELELPVKVIGFSANSMPPEVTVHADLSKLRADDLSVVIDDFEDPAVA